MYQGITPENWFKKKGMELKHPCVGILQSATIWEKTKELMILPKILEKISNIWTIISERTVGQMIES